MSEGASTLSSELDQTQTRNLLHHPLCARSMGGEFIHTASTIRPRELRTTPVHPRTARAFTHMANFVLWLSRNRNQTTEENCPLHTRIVDSGNHQQCWPIVTPEQQLLQSQHRGLDVSNSRGDLIWWYALCCLNPLSRTPTSCYWCQHIPPL